MDNPMDYRWTWYWRTDEAGNADCGIVAEPRKGHAYSVSRCPRYVTEARWREFATHICNLHNASLEPETAHIAIGPNGKFAVMVSKIA